MNLRYTNNKTNLSHGAGFTLVEILVVVTIIVVLSSVTVVLYNGVQNNAYASKASATTSSLVKLVKTYHAMYRKFPANTVASYGCFGEPSQYPAAPNFPAGACEWTKDITSTLSYSYAHSELMTELRKVSSQVPDGLLPTANVLSGGSMTFGSRGIYYTFYNCLPNGKWPDGSVGSCTSDDFDLFYYLPGDIDCPVDFNKGYYSSAKVTGCSIWESGGDRGVSTDIDTRVFGIKSV